MNAGAAYANGVAVLSSAAADETARNRLTMISEDRDVFISLLLQSVALDAEMAAALSHRTDHGARRRARDESLRLNGARLRKFCSFYAIKFVDGIAPGAFNPSECAAFRVA